MMTKSKLIEKWEDTLLYEVPCEECPINKLCHTGKWQGMPCADVLSEAFALIDKMCDEFGVAKLQD